MIKRKTLDRHLDRIEAEANALGVHLRTGILGTTGITIETIERRSGKPGTGAQTMFALCTFADAEQLAISVYANEGHPTLIAYYTQFGFEIDPDKCDEAMLRRLPLPQS